MNKVFSYKVLDQRNRTIFVGADVAVFADGAWCLSQASSLYESSQISGAVLGLGRYRGFRFTWTCPTGTSVAALVKNFESKRAVLMELEWPEGADNTTQHYDDENQLAALATFPSLIQSQGLLPSTLSWHGSFVQSVRGDEADVGGALNDHTRGPQGGPFVFYDASDIMLETVVLASPFGGMWNAYTAGNHTDWTGTVEAFTPGLSGRISRIPPGFRQSYLLYEGSHGGITDSLAEWGSVMQANRKTFHSHDVTLEKIGYQTDNGAMYCFCKDSNCSKTLLQEKDYLESIDVPIGYLSFQGAGTSSGRGKAAPWCVDRWSADGGSDPNHYPLDVATFQKALDVPLQLYAPYFCPGSGYFGSDSNWTSVVSDTNLPSCSDFAFETINSKQSKEFFLWFLRKGVSAGMISFESDFMNQNANCIPEFVLSATATDEWLKGMADAAHEMDLSVQWCYASPNEVLASLDLPSVTNFRVSFDFCYGHSWDIGESSLLVWAVGAAASKDTVWTTDNNRTETPGCQWTTDHETIAAELHVVLALMATGPVGISDGIGMTNANLLRRIMKQDGTLLQPSKPITAVDSTFLNDVKLKGYLFGTYGLGPSWIFVAFKLQDSFAVTPRDFWPRIQDKGRLLAYRGFSSDKTCQNGRDAVESGCVTLWNLDDHSGLDRDAAVFVAPRSSFEVPGSEFAPHVVTVWQACEKAREEDAGGWFFLGELSKYVPLSPKRFDKVECTFYGMSVSLRGSLGESIVLTALRPRSGPAVDGKSLWYEVVQTEVTIVSLSESMTVHFRSLSIKTLAA